MISREDEVFCHHIAQVSPRSMPALMEPYNCPHSRFCTVCGIVIGCNSCNIPASKPVPILVGKLPTPHLLAELDAIIRDKLEQTD